MRHSSDYLLNAHAHTKDLPEQLWRRVCRFDFRAPGFALLDIGMVDLKFGMSAVHHAKTLKRLMYYSLGRFDQQETTKFHLDGGPAESILMVGYEPTRVKSRIFLADYSKCAYDLGVSVEKFLKEYNPMFSKGAEMLANYSTAIQTDPSHWQILVINNSSKSWQADGRAMQGVMHMAYIEAPDSTERRIVNSTLIYTAEIDEAVSECETDQEQFIASEKISQKNF